MIALVLAATVSAQVMNAKKDVSDLTATRAHQTNQLKADRSEAKIAAVKATELKSQMFKAPLKAEDGWGEWETYGTGTYVYEMTAQSMWDAGYNKTAAPLTQENMTVMKRQSATDANKFQIKIENWMYGHWTGLDQIDLVWDAETQTTGEVYLTLTPWEFPFYGATGYTTYMTDMYTYAGIEAPAAQPQYLGASYIDAEQGRLQFDIAYYAGNATGTQTAGVFDLGYDYFQLDGDYKNYNLDITNTFFGDNNFNFHAEINDNSEVVLGMTNQEFESTQDMITYINGLLQGTNEGIEFNTSGNKTIAIPNLTEGEYTMLGVNKAGTQWQAFAYSYTYTPTEGWVNKGFGEYSDPFFSAFFDLTKLGFPESQWKGTPIVAASTETAGMYKLLQPYYEMYDQYLSRYSDIEWDTTGDNDMTINAVNPNEVYLLPGQLGISLDMSQTTTPDYQMMTYTSDIADCLANNYEIDPAFYGKLENGVVTFPLFVSGEQFAALYLDFAGDSYFMNVAGCEFKAVLPVQTGIQGISADDANAPVEYFNLQGIRVSNPQEGGLYIRRQGKTVSKVLVK